MPVIGALVGVPVGMSVGMSVGTTVGVLVGMSVSLPTRTRVSISVVCVTGIVDLVLDYAVLEVTVGVPVTLPSYSWPTVDAVVDVACVAA